MSRDIRFNNRGAVTVPFFVVGSPEYDLTLILKALKVVIPNQPVPVSAAVLATKAAKAAGRKVLGS